MSTRRGKKTPTRRAGNVVFPMQITHLLSHNLPKTVHRWVQFTRKVCDQHMIITPKHIYVGLWLVLFIVSLQSDISGVFKHRWLSVKNTQSLGNFFTRFYTSADFFLHFYASIWFYIVVVLVLVVFVFLYRARTAYEEKRKIQETSLEGASFTK